MDTVKKLGGNIPTRPDSIPQQLYNEIVKGGRPRLGPIPIKGADPYTLEGIGAKVICNKRGVAIHAIVDFSSGIKIFLAYQRDKTIVGVDIGMRHVATVVAIKGTDIYVSKSFGNKEIMGKLMRYTGEPQGLGSSDEIRRILKPIINDIVNYIVELNPKVVVMEDLRKVNGRIGYALRTVQDMLIKSLYERGVKYERRSAYSTSRICSKCGYKGGELIGSLFVCPACGFTADRDFNAALNLATKGYYS
ncbi:transposase [Sulfolobales archaeon HS-7]|nr:transposase [Sulfolobales archaeon HS-7]